MCIVFLAFGDSIHPDHKLIIASNRDEYFDRPTHRAHVWPAHGPAASDSHRVVCGVDLERDDHGTWLGLATNPTSGRFAFVTNYREPIPLRMKHDNKPNFTDYESRGRLVSDFLHSTMSPSEYAMQLRKEAREHANAWLGFNLVFGTVSPGGERRREQGVPEFDVWYVSNRKGSWHADPKRYMDRELVAFRLAPETVWGISNGSIVPLSEVADTTARLQGQEDGQIVTLDQVERPFWTKIERGIARIDRLLQRTRNGEEKVDVIGELWEMLKDPTRADPSSLPSTGLPEVIEHALSSVFVPAASMSKGFSGSSSYYGTRSSTLVLVSKAGDAVYLERDHDLPAAYGSAADVDPAPLMRPNAVLPPDVQGSLNGCEAPPIEDCSLVADGVSRQGFVRRVHMDRNEVEWKFHLFGDVVRTESPSILE